MTNSNVGSKGFIWLVIHITVYHQQKSGQEHKHGRKLKTRADLKKKKKPRRSVVYLLAPHDWLSLLIRNPALPAQGLYHTKMVRPSLIKV
jgi:hypothetical protein